MSQIYDYGPLLEVRTVGRCSTTVQSSAPLILPSKLHRPACSAPTCPEAPSRSSSYLHGISQRCRQGPVTYHILFGSLLAIDLPTLLEGLRGRMLMTDALSRDITSWVRQ